MPDKLRHTVLFLIGINCCLCAVEEHYHPHRDTPNESSQLSFMSNPRGGKCVVYQEDLITKTHDGGLKDMCHDRKVVWMYRNNNMMRGPFGVGIGSHKTDNHLVFVFCRYEQVPALIIDV